MISITDASKLSNVSRQAIYLTVKSRKLPATRIQGKWMIKVEDLQSYRKNRYSRSLSIYEGKPLYDLSAGEYTVPLAAKKIGVKDQALYYALRLGVIKGIRRGVTWIVTQEQLEVYKTRKLNKKTKQKKRNRTRHKVAA